MQEKVYCSFFILCVILSQGILVKCLEEDVGASSKLRQKRVIDRSRGGDAPLKGGDVPYVVNLKKFNRIHCMATILSHRTAITAARCFDHHDLMAFTVQSGSAYTYRGNDHHIIAMKMHGHNSPGRTSFLVGIALFTVNPPFVYSSHTRGIGLHSGPVLAGMVGTVFGWGTRINSGPVETKYPKRLRFISVPIMNHRECQNTYRGHFPISDEDICTYHSEKLCGDTDAGAPLVIDNQLVGVHIGGVLMTGTECPITPDIFVLLQHLNYGSWIASNIVY